MSDALEELRGGIDESTWRRLARMLGDKDADPYSYVRRPGSWEWHTETGAGMRDMLRARGYVQSADPAASWRVRWTKGGES